MRKYKIISKISKFSFVVFLMMFLFMFSVNAKLERNTIIESFENVNDIFLTGTQIEKLNISETTTTDFLINSDLDTWYVGSYIPNSLNDFTRFNVSNTTVSWIRTQSTTLGNIILQLNTEQIYKFDSQSKIRIFYNSTADMINNEAHLNIVLVTSNNSCVGYTTYSGFESGFDTNYCSNNLEVNDYNINLIGQELNYIDFNISDFSNTEINNVNRILFYYRIPITTDSFQKNSIYNISFIDVLNGTNELPFFNFTIDAGDICFNTSSNLVQEKIINISVDVFDFENDTILYANSNNRDNFYTIGTFDNRLLSTSSCYSVNPYAFLNPIWNLLRGTVYAERECPENSGIIIESDDLPEYKTFSGFCEVTENNLTSFYIDSIVNENGDTVEALLHNPACEKKLESFLDVYTGLGSLQDFNYAGNFYFDNALNTEFNFTFYNNIYTNKVIQLMFRVNDTDDKLLSIYNVNSTDITFLGNTNFTELDILVGYINLGIRFFYDENEVIIYQNNETLYNVSSYDNSPSLVNYIGTSIKDNSNNKFWIQNFIYGGNVLKPVFKNDYDRNVTILNKGLNSYTLYITDDIHPDDYKYKTEFFYVNECKYNINAIDDLVNKNKINPGTSSEFFNGLIVAYRQFYLMFIELGILTTVLFGIKAGIFMFIIYRYFDFSNKADQNHNDIFRKIFIQLFIIVTILYIGFLIEKSWFVIFSIIGLLYFSYEILNITGITGTESTKTTLYTVLMYSILSFIWFGIFDIIFGVKMGFPSLNNANGSINFLSTSLLVFKGLLYFNIPDVPTFLNLINSLIRSLGFLSMIEIIVNKIPFIGN